MAFLCYYLEGRQSTETCTEPKHSTPGRRQKKCAMGLISLFSFLELTLCSVNASMCASCIVECVFFFCYSFSKFNICRSCSFHFFRPRHHTRRRRRRYSVPFRSQTHQSYDYCYSFLLIVIITIMIIVNGLLKWSMRNPLIFIAHSILRCNSQISRPTTHHLMLRLGHVHLTIDANTAEMPMNWPIKNP